jgi:N-sulfoglucosamine sulfohydrolase
LDIVAVEHPPGLDGRSFEPLLRGEAQEDRDMIFKEYNENSGGSQNPMRAVQTRQYLYIFSPWSNGERAMQTATRGTSTYRRMVELARSEPKIAERLDLFDHRVVEELYDVANDPDCLTNLAGDAAHAAELAKLREALEAWMVKTADPMLEVFRERDDPGAREAFMQRVEKEAAERGPRAKKERKALRRRAQLDANGRRAVDRRARKRERARPRVDAEE